MRRFLILAVISFSALVAVLSLALTLARPVLGPGSQPGGGPTLADPARTTPILDEPASPPPRRAIPEVPPPLPTSVAEVVRMFPRGLSALKARLGARAALTSVNVNEISVLFAYRRGRSDNASVLRWRPERLALEPADPRFAGTSSAAEQAFPIGAVRPRVPGALVADARRRVPRGEVLTLHLLRLPVSRALTWQVVVRSGNRYLTYRAGADGGRLRELR